MVFFPSPTVTVIGVPRWTRQAGHCDFRLSWSTPSFTGSLSDEGVLPTDELLCKSRRDHDKRFNRAGRSPTPTPGLQRPQEVQEMLLVGGRQRLEEADYRVRLRALALVRENRGIEVSRTAIVKEEQSLAEAPERCRAEFVPRGQSLRDAIGEPAPHVVKKQIGKQIHRLLRQRLDIGPGRFQRLAYGTAQQPRLANTWWPRCSRRRGVGGLRRVPAGA